MACHVGRAASLRRIATVVTESCSFETARLTVDVWHTASLTGEGAPRLPEVVGSIMTPAATRALPAEWQGAYPRSRAVTWIRERDGDGPTHLAIERSSGTAVGLVILFESAADDGPDVEVHLGYVLAESAWGQGLGSELVEGFVEWCRGERQIRSLIGGVAADNLASVRILEKNGFRPMDSDVDDADAERMYILRLR